MGGHQLDHDMMPMEALKNEFPNCLNLYMPATFYTDLLSESHRHRCRHHSLEAPVVVILVSQGVVVVVLSYQPAVCFCLLPLGVSLQKGLS